MTIIKYDDIYNYFQNSIIDLNTSLYNDATTQDNLSFKFFKNTGDYLSSMKNIELDSKAVLVNIINGGGVQDSSISIDAYSQIITMEFLGLETQRDSIVSLLTNFAASFKNYTTTLSGSLVIISVANYPEYSAKFACYGNEKFTADLTINITVIPNAKYSNKYILTINGTKVLYDKLTINRTTEMTASLEKTTENKFFPNITAQEISISGLYVDNVALNSLFLDCAQNALFDTAFSLQLSNDSTVILSKDYYAKSITFQLNCGSIASWNAVFYVSKPI